LPKERVERDEEDLVRLYLTDIGQYPLLTKDDEVRLAKAIEAGNASRHSLEQGGKDLSAARRRELRKGAIEGEDAQRTFVQSNLRLVVSIAKKYQASGLPLLDLIQEGNLGLMHAVEKFDWRKGFKFSTYATWWIRQAVSRALADKARTIRMPVHIVEKLTKITGTEHRLRAESGRQPSSDEIAFELDMTAEEVESIRGMAQMPISLETPVGDEGGMEFGQFIEDEHTASPDNAVGEMLRLETLARCLETLVYRERRVLELRFGLNGEQPHTLEEVGLVFEVTRERIRQIEMTVLKKLRSLIESQSLRDVA